MIVATDSEGRGCDSWQSGADGDCDDGEKAKRTRRGSLPGGVFWVGLGTGGAGLVGLGVGVTFGIWSWGWFRTLRSPADNGTVGSCHFLESVVDERWRFLDVVDGIWVRTSANQLLISFWS